MAREEDEGGSLDMLLDTLCNTFGGIILIALLLALSVNKKSVELYEKLVKTDDNKSELIREREQLKNSLLDLKDENTEILEDLEDDAYSKREEIEEIKDNLDDLNSDSSALEKLAELESQKLREMEDAELKIEEERLTMEEELSRLESILEHQTLTKELKKKPYRKVSLPQQKDTRKKPLPVIVAHGKMYPMISIGIGSIEKNEDGLVWNQTPDNRFQVKVDPGRGVDPMDDDSLDLFLSTVNDAPRSVRQNFFLNLFVYSDSENFAIFNKIRDEAVLRKLDYNWIPISELPLVLRSDNVPWKVQ
ncbi:MAG: hypothetical protein CMI23_10995 [Opitutae bacterium]|nr:hypothetical protein [Opitutae bacterium]|tara:strand:- start:1065 stop:1979 length:915 start_codon:yes stop_codon:yes gene_type:complete